MNKEHMSTTTSECILILGMHRSGTSVLSGCFHLLGADLGSNLMPANEANQSGYFENHDLVLIHDILLRDLGCRWDMVGSLPQDWQQTEAAQSAKDKIAHLIEREFAQSELWAVKDPRLCRLLPLWLELFQEKDIRPRIVFLTRHPYEVALSLKKRDGFDMFKGHLLWLSHTREGLANCRERDHSILTYDQLLADPIVCLENISRDLDIEFPKSIRHNVQRIMEFVRPDLKHCTLSGTDCGPFAPYAWLYDQLRLSQARALETGFGQTGPEANVSLDSPAQVLDMKGFPLMTRQQPDRPASSHASSMFDNLLSVISSYEQADLNRDILRRRRLLEADQHGSTLYAQVYFPGNPSAPKQNLYAEDRSRKVLLAPGEWQQLLIDVHQPEYLRENGLRLDPLNTKGMVRISAVKLLDGVSREPVWSLPGTGGFQDCTIERDGLLLGHAESLHFCATGNDPRIILPPVPDLPDRPLQLEIWIKAGRELTELVNLWSEREGRLQKQSNKVKELQGQLSQNEEEWSHVKEQMDELVQQNDRLINQWEEQKQEWTDSEQDLQAKLQKHNAQLEQWQNKQNQWNSKENELHTAIQGKDQALQEKDNKLQELQTANDDLKNRLVNRNKKLEQLQKQIQELEQSLTVKDNELQGAQSKLQSTEQKLGEQQASIEQLMEAKGQLEGSLQAMEAELEQVRAGLKERDEQLLARQQEIEGLHQEKERVLSEKQQALELTQDRVTQLEKDLQTKEQEKAKALKEYEEAAKQLTDLQKKLKAKQNQLNKLEQEKEKIRNQLQSRDAELKQAQNKLKTKMNSLTQARSKLQGFKGSLNNTDVSQNVEAASTGDLEPLEQEVQRLQKQLAQQEDLTRQYFTELAKAEEELARVG